MHPKTKIACRATITEAAKLHPYLYMWTFTFPAHLGHDHSHCMDIWRDFLRYARCRADLFSGGMRVCELHKSGALHIHVLTSKRDSVLLVRPLWAKFGGGRVHVCVKRGEACQYVAKYLSKGRGGFKKGTRVWSSWGTWRAFSIRSLDVDIDTVSRRAFRWASRLMTIEFHRTHHRLPNGRERWQMFIEATDKWLIMYLVDQSDEVPF